MLAEGMITPPITVSSAIEGLAIKYPGIPTIGITIAIISALFFIQRFGTVAVGQRFWPDHVDLVYYAGRAGYQSDHLYAGSFPGHQPDDGHRIVAQQSEYAGDHGRRFPVYHRGGSAVRRPGALRAGEHQGQLDFCQNLFGAQLFGPGRLAAAPRRTALEENPFYGMMPHWFLWPGIIIATLAAIIASQSMISGSFTLASEAIRLGFLPKMTVKFPTNMKGQIYIPAVNTFLWLGCVSVVFYFQQSSRMEAAYGLSVVCTMFCTTILLSNWMVLHRVKSALIWLFLVFYLAWEGSFFIANTLKFFEGGYVTVIMGALLFGMMLLWVTAKRIRSRYTDEVKIKDYLDQLIMLSNDDDIPKYATNLVFLTGAKSPKKVEDRIMYSILQTQPKRADVYWFVHIETTDEPYTMEYEVNAIAPNDVYKVNFRLGFRVQQRMNVFMKKVVEELVENEELTIYSRYHSSASKYPTGDFRFVIIEEFLSNENELPWFDQLILSVYLTVKGWVSSPKNWFGLDSDSVEEEQAPLVLQPVKGNEPGCFDR